MKMRILKGNEQYKACGIALVQEMGDKGLSKSDETIEVQIEFSLEPVQIKALRICQIEDTLSACIEKDTVDVRV